MNIASVNSALGGVVAPREQPNARPADADASRGTAAQTTARGATATAPTFASPVPSRAAATSLPPQAPAGTDPALWSILTNEERTFFARQASSGPLTYLKVMMPNATQPATAASRGRRIDVRA